MHKFYFPFYHYSKLKNSSPLSKLAVKGGAWLGLGCGLENSVRFLRNIILARFLVPEAFGVVAIVMAIASAFESFTEMGIREVIIQNKRGNQKSFLSCAWLFSLLRSLVLFMLVYFLSPWIARFYDMPQLTSLIRVGFLYVLFNGALSPLLYVTLKEMNYKRWIVAYHGGAIFGIVTAIIMGIYGYGVWALVIGYVIEGACRFILSYVLCPFLPTFRIDFEDFKSIYQFAAGIFGIPILVYLYENIDLFIIGKLCSAEDLGIYTLAYKFLVMPMVLFSALLSPILLPLFSRHQNDQNKLLNNIIFTSKILALFLFPFYAIMISFAPQLLGLIYGSDYIRASTAFQFICISMLIKVQMTSLVVAYLALGKPELNRYAAFIRMCVMLTCVVPFIYYGGINGAAIARICSAFIWMVVNLIILRHLFDMNTMVYTNSMKSGALIGIFVLTMWGLSFIL